LKLPKFGVLFAQAVAIAALLATTVFLHRLAGFSAECFNSKILDRFIFFSGAKAAEIPHCKRAWGWAEPQEPVPERWHIQWQRLSQKADQLMNVWPLPGRRLHMILADEEPFITLKEGSQILVGAAIAERPELWLRQIFRAWIADTSIQLPELETSILAGFMTAVANGEFAQTNAAGQRRAGDAVHWAGAAIPPAQYCLSPWRDAADFAICDSAPADHALMARRGLGTLFTKGLWELHRLAGWSERRRLWEWLRSDVALGRAPLLPKFQPDQPAVSDLGRVLEYWAARTFADPDRRAQMLFLVQSRLQLSRAFAPPLVVETAADFLPGLEGLVKTPSGMEWWSAEGRAPVYAPTGKPLHWIRIGCRVPAAQEAARLARRTVLFVRHCGDPAELSGWENLNSADIAAFIAANPKVGVIWLNAQGLRQTLAQLGPDGPDDEARPLSLRRLRRWSRWREDAWDKAVEAFRPAAAVDLVLRHRATRELL
jgi:hypothetical protein